MGVVGNAVDAFMLYLLNLFCDANGDLRGYYNADGNPISEDADGYRYRSDNWKALTPADSPYTILDGGPDTFFFQTGAGDVTAIMPTLADNINRKLTFVKIHADNTAMLDGEGAETIGGSTTFEFTGDGDIVELLDRSTDWAIAKYPQTANNGIPMTFAAGYAIGDVVILNTAVNYGVITTAVANNALRCGVVKSRRNTANKGYIQDSGGPVAVTRINQAASVVGDYVQTAAVAGQVKTGVSVVGANIGRVAAVLAGGAAGTLYIILEKS